MTTTLSRIHTLGQRADVGLRAGAVVVARFHHVGGGPLPVPDVCQRAVVRLDVFGVTPG